MLYMMCHCGTVVMCRHDLCKNKGPECYLWCAIVAVLSYAGMISVRKGASDQNKMHATGMQMGSMLLKWPEWAWSLFPVHQGLDGSYKTST